jgi:hypothetical protein
MKKISLLLNNIDSLVYFGKKFIHPFDFLISLVPYFFESLGLDLLRFIHKTELAASDSMATFNLLETGHCSFGFWVFLFFRSFL